MARKKSELPPVPEGVKAHIVEGNPGREDEPIYGSCDVCRRPGQFQAGVELCHRCFETYSILGRLLQARNEVRLVLQTVLLALQEASSDARAQEKKRAAKSVGGRS